MPIKNILLVEKLEKTGFTQKEAAIYVALLELGGAFPSKIAEYTKINRSTVYHILLGLSVRGLVNEIEKRNKAFYQVERPERVVAYGESKIRQAEENLVKTKSILPDLEGLFGTLGNRPKVTYYENIEGILNLYEDMVVGSKKYEMLAFSNAKEIEKVFPERFFENFRRSKERIGITSRGIVPDTPEDRAYNEKFFSGYKENVIAKLRYVASDKFPFKGEVVVYSDNKVAIVNLNKEYLTGVIIEDQTIHSMMKMIFELSWDSKQVTE